MRLLLTGKLIDFRVRLLMYHTLVQARPLVFLAFLAMEHHPNHPCKPNLHNANPCTTFVDVATKMRNPHRKYFALSVTRTQLLR